MLFRFDESKQRRYKSSIIIFLIEVNAESNTVVPFMSQPTQNSYETYIELEQRLAHNETHL